MCRAAAIALSRPSTAQAANAGPVAEIVARMPFRRIPIITSKTEVEPCLSIAPGGSSPRSVPIGAQHRCGPAPMARRVLAALCAALLIVAVAGDEPASDITLKDVTVSLLEASGTPASVQQMAGPSTGRLGALDHTRTMKVCRQCPHPCTTKHAPCCCVFSAVSRIKLNPDAMLNTMHACAAAPARSAQVSLATALASAPDEDFRPQQVFLRLTSRVSGGAAYFAAVKAKDGTLYATAKSADIQKQVQRLF